MKGKGIVCIGDSLTAGFGGGNRAYPSVLRSCLEEDALRTGEAAPEVVNLGVNGEDTVTILGRTGAVPFVLTENLVLNNDGYPAPISFASPAGGEICPLVYGDAGLEKIWLRAPDGTEAEGRLTLEGGYFAGEQYCFRTERITRPGEAVRPGQETQPGEETQPAQETAGGAVIFPAGTKIETRAARAYRGFVPVVLMGANGQFETVDELVLQHRALLSFYQVPAGCFLVLGLHLGSKRDTAEMERKFAQAFGKNYLSVRAYMSTEGLRDAGMEPTERERADMAEGRTPERLLFDGLHFNGTGYELLGKLVYRKLKELGIV